MSEQDGAQSSTKQRGSRKINIVNQQNDKKALAAQRPANDDKEAWKGYWKAQGQPWRTEPEIDGERQQYLAERRSITPNIEQGIYPFKDIKLSRADVEWLLTTHENGRGPVDWSHESQHERQGLDLRGADLCQINLTRLPLTNMHGALDLDERTLATKEQCEMAAVHLEGATLQRTHLEGADLYKAHLEGADLYLAHLERAYLTEAHLEGADLHGAQLARTELRQAYLGGAKFRRAHLERTNLENAVLSDEKHIGPQLADVHWIDVHLSVVNWTNVETLDDEYKARQKMRRGEEKDREGQLREYDLAIRANRQLAAVLQTQGLNEDAARFAYRAQKLQRVIFWRQGKFVQYPFSLFLDLLTGYGYKPWRSFLAYLIVIIGFATSYYVLGQTVGPHLSPVGSVVFSMTSFHGRGFFPGGIQLDDPLTILAAIEAFVGLLIEVTFIATLTRRLFGR
jgi:uncharacterized protein YjbI with pentapeptide repeats